MRLKSSQVVNPSGGGGVTYPSTSHQKRARRSGSAQSKVTWNFLITDIGAPYRGPGGPAAHFLRQPDTIAEHYVLQRWPSHANPGHVSGAYAR